MIVLWDLLGKNFLSWLPARVVFSLCRFYCTCSFWAGCGIRWYRFLIIAFHLLGLDLLSQKYRKNEPPHDKVKKLTVSPADAQADLSLRWIV